MTPNKFQHAGLDWIPHTPGDPMPCPPDTLVRVLFRNYEDCADFAAASHDWRMMGDEWDCIGWHPVEEQPEWPNAYTTVETGILRRVLGLLEAGDIEQAKREIRKELE